MEIDGTPTAAPEVTTSGFAIDSEGNFPILFRGPNVRSAKNAWALPSGLHEIGLTLAEQLAIELEEELGIVAEPRRSINITTYENIACVDDWHWVINLQVVPVQTLSTLVNKEPHKHTAIETVHYSQVLKPSFYNRAWTPGLGEAIRDNKERIYEAMTSILDRSSSKLR